MRKRTYVISIISIIVLALGVFAGWKYFNKPERAVTTSTAETARNDYRSGDERTPVNGSSSSQGGALDTEGDDTPATQPVGALTSEEGGLTLYTPTSGQALKSGALLSGTAKISTVYYRLVDDERGVIAQGQLNTTNGKYSGNLQFKSYGKTGELNVYSIDPDSGAETNNIELKIVY